MRDLIREATLRYKKATGKVGRDGVFVFFAGSCLCRPLPGCDPARWFDRSVFRYVNAVPLFCFGFCWESPRRQA